MGWVGINCWCRLRDINTFPAGIFASFIFEYAFPLTYRTSIVQYKVVVLDGEIINKLHKKLTNSNNFELILNKEVSKIYKNKDKYDIYFSDNKKRDNFDLVICATQPKDALSIFNKSKNCEINKSLINELNKWKKTMKCMTLVHNDKNLIENYAFVQKRLFNKITKKEYIHFVTNAIGGYNNNIYISYIYGVENFKDFKSNHINSNKIIKELYPTLPLFTCKNTVNRLEKWNNIHSKCKDIYWIGCTQTGLQFHNDGILSSKRLVSKILEKEKI